jgi:guanylate kinase
MTAKMGIRDIVRNFSVLENYDYVEIEDKKTKEPKGMFISPKLAEKLKETIEQKAKEEKEEKLNFINKFVGFLEVEDRFKDKTIQEMKQMIAKEKYGE